MLSVKQNIVYCRLLDIITHKVVIVLTLLKISITRLKTHAYATKLRCSQVGCFAAEDTLVLEDLTLENVLHNISNNRKIINANDSLFHSNFRTVNLKDNVHKMISSS